VKALQTQLRQLKPRLRQNMDKQAAIEREQLLHQRVSGDTKQREKQTLLREAERGTMALKEASQMMRRVCVNIISRCVYNNHILMTSLGT
jgi:thermostable 8-oxoguanine DNA glycosylase